MACLSPSPTSAIRREIARTISVSSDTAASARGVARNVNRVPLLNSTAPKPVFTRSIWSLMRRASCSATRCSVRIASGACSVTSRIIRS